jgi:hypothetical protein
MDDSRQGARPCGDQPWLAESVIATGDGKIECIVPRTAAICIRAQCS